MFMTNQQATKLSQPRVGPLHDPATLVTPQFAPVLIPSPFVVLAIGGNQFDASFPQALPQRVGIVSGIGNHTLRLLPRAALRTRPNLFLKHALGMGRTDPMESHGRMTTPLIHNAHLCSKPQVRLETGIVAASCGANWRTPRAVACLLLLL